MINYPSFRTKNTPTPSEKLVICDKCQKARWTAHSAIQNHCFDCHDRMREADFKEYSEAKSLLVE